MLLWSLGQAHVASWNPEIDAWDPDYGGQEDRVQYNVGEPRFWADINPPGPA